MHMILLNIINPYILNLQFFAIKGCIVFIIRLFLVTRLFFIIILIFFWDFSCDRICIGVLFCFWCNRSLLGSSATSHCRAIATVGDLKLCWLNFNICHCCGLFFALFWKMEFINFSNRVTAQLISSWMKLQTTQKQKWSEQDLKFGFIGFLIYVDQNKLPRCSPVLVSICHIRCHIFPCRTLLQNIAQYICPKQMFKEFPCFRPSLPHWVTNSISSCNTIPTQWLIYITKHFSNKFCFFRM